ncbi:MAG: pentapeptide repeat-containing protein, partial [Halocynthiibacter sp.]
YLQNANLISAKLQGADLWDTSLRGAHLWRAKLQGVRIEGTKLQGANLMNAELDVDTLFRPEFPIQLAWKNIDISDIEVSKDHIQSTYGDASVTLPNGIARPSHWPKEKLSNKEFIDFFHKWRDEIMDSDID